jgi:LCP family protein required for cell wall assembly
VSSTPDHSAPRGRSARSGRQPLARHGVMTAPNPFVQILKMVGIMLAVVLVSGIGVAAYATYDLASNFADDAVELKDQKAVPPDIGAIEGGVNLLITGTDECEPEYAGYFGGRCKGPDSEGQLNDVNLLVHISDAPRRVTVISFPRDLMIPIPSCTAEDGSQTSEMSKQPINSAYSVGGLGCVVSTVSQLSGMNIPFAAKVSFGNVINITDAVGGVDVCIANGIQDRHTGIDWPAGIRNIQGIEALQFLRTRHGVGNGSDLGRISNQQQYMSRLARKLVSEEVLSNPTTLYKLASTAVDNVTPSKSLTNPLTLMQIALAVKNVPFEEIVFISYPVWDDPADRNKVVPNRDAADQLWAALAENRPLVLSGQASQGEGVVVEAPAPDAGAAPDPAATTDPNAVTLSPDIAGQTAAQETCSNGNAG